MLTGVVIVGRRRPEYITLVSSLPVSSFDGPLSVFPLPVAPLSVFPLLVVPFGVSPVAWKPPGDVDGLPLGVNAFNIA